MGATATTVPRPCSDHPELSARYTTTLDQAFDTYAALIPKLVAHIDPLVPDEPDTPPAARDRAVRARALDALRGLLPAATEANLGIFASGQAFESLLIRLQAHPLPEARDCGAAMLRELRKVIPAFLTRVDREDRGLRHGAYLADTEQATAALAVEFLGDPPGRPDGPIVRLVDWDRDGEARVVAHALWPASGRSFADVRGAAEGMGVTEIDGRAARVLGRCGATGATGPGGRSRRRPTRSRSSATTGPTATCSATAC